MSTKDIVRNAYVSLAADVLDAFGRANAGRASRVEGINEFKELYDQKVAKLREKGKIGPKGWAKLEEAMPSEVKPYFRSFQGGFDMTTDSGFLGFLGAIQGLARDLPVNDRAAIATGFATRCADVFSEAQGPEDEDDDDGTPVF